MSNGAGFRRGASLIEFAAVLTVVITVIFGVIETGRLMLAYITLAEAARAGVRSAIVTGADVSGTLASKRTAVQTLVQGVGTAAGFTLPAPTVCYGSSVSVACDGLGTAAVGQSVTVTVSYSYIPLTPTFSSAGFSISSTSVGTICF